MSVLVQYFEIGVAVSEFLPENPWCSASQLYGRETGKPHGIATLKWRCL